MTDDFAADEEILKGAEERASASLSLAYHYTHYRYDIPALAAIARKYQRALRETLFALDEVIGTKRSDAWGNAVNRCRQSRTEVRRILEGGEE